MDEHLKCRLELKCTENICLHNLGQQVDTEVDISVYLEHRNKEKQRSEKTDD